MIQQERVLERFIADFTATDQGQPTFEHQVKFSAADQRQGDTTRGTNRQNRDRCKAWVRFGRKTRLDEVGEETAGRLMERTRDMMDLGRETGVYLVSEGRRADWEEDVERMEEGKTIHFNCRMRRRKEEERK